MPVKRLASFCQKLSFTGGCGREGALSERGEWLRPPRLPPLRRGLEPERERRSER